MTAKLSLFDLIKAAEYIDQIESAGPMDDTPSSGSNSSVSSPNSSISSAISPNSSSSNSTNVSHLYCNEDVHFENGSTNNNGRYIKLSSNGNNEKSGGSFILNGEFLAFVFILLCVFCGDFGDLELVELIVKYYFQFT